MALKKQVAARKRLGEQIPAVKKQKLDSTGKHQANQRVTVWQEMEEEERQAIPRPLNKKILARKGSLGVPKPVKLPVTKPEEFHFRTEKRTCRHLHIPPTGHMNNLSLDSEPQHRVVNLSTSPKPFRLLTDDRGAAKQRNFMRHLEEQEKKEEEARIPKANPLPYTIDYAVIPRKPEAKECTKPEPFQLESIARHEREMQRMTVERTKAEREEAQMRKFRAQPNKSNVGLHIPRVPVAPVTEVHEFNFRSDVRAVERLEFEKKLLEKEMMYRKFKEERQAARQTEEERVIKEMRKGMIPHARPMPVFDRPFVPQKSSKEPTEPKPPKFQLPRHRDQS